MQSRQATCHALLLCTCWLTINDQLTEGQVAESTAGVKLRRILMNRVPVDASSGTVLGLKDLQGPPHDEAVQIIHDVLTKEHLDLEMLMKCMGAIDKYDAFGELGALRPQLDAVEARTPSGAKDEIPIETKTTVLRLVALLGYSDKDHQQYCRAKANQLFAAIEAHLESPDTFGSSETGALFDTLWLSNADEDLKDIEYRATRLVKEYGDKFKRRVVSETKLGNGATVREEEWVGSPPTDDQQNSYQFHQKSAVACAYLLDLSKQKHEIDLDVPPQRWTALAQIVLEDPVPLRFVPTYWAALRLRREVDKATRSDAMRRALELLLKKTDQDDGKRIRNTAYEWIKNYGTGLTKDELEYEKKQEETQHPVEK